MGSWQRLRPYAELEDRHLAALRAAFRRHSESEQAASADELAFEADLDEDEPERLASLRLLQRVADGYLPSTLGLLYLDEASGLLEPLDRIVRTAHAHYRPGAGPLSVPEVASRAQIPEDVVRRLAPFTAELGVSERDGTIHPSRRHRKVQDLESALAERFSTIAERQRSYREPAVVPFAFALTSLAARNFRGLRDVRLELDGVKVLVGPNGAGKSTVLDTLTFVALAVEEGLDAAVSQEGGLERLRTHGARGPVELVVGYRADWGDGPRRGTYELAVDQVGGQVVAERERLELDEPEGKRTLVDGRRGRARVLGRDHGELTIYQAPSDLVLHAPDVASDVVGRIAAALRRVFLVERDPLFRATAGERSWSDIGPASRRRKALPPANLIGELAGDPAAVERLEAYVTQLVPTVARLHRVVRTGEATTLEVEERGLPGRLRLDELSAGTRQMLLLAAVYVMPQPPAALLVEEPDGGLHPGALPALADLLRSIAGRTAVLCTTHGPAFVDTLDPEREVLAVSKEEGGARIRPLAEALRSRSWLRSFGAGAEAFRRGASERT